MNTILNLDVEPGTISWINIDLLSPHPDNSKIYGEEEDVTDLAQSISESGWMKPLTTNRKGVVIAGHRRHKAGKKLGWTQVPVIVEDFTSPEAEMERLLRENENRDKTSEQQIREGIKWEDVEKAKGRHGGDRRSEDSSAKFFALEKGRVNDIIARRTGLGTARTYEKGKEIVKAIDTELSLGDTRQRGELLLMTLNEQSISAASNLLDKMTKADEKAREEEKRKEEEKLKQQESARQRYLEAARKAEHCTLYHCSVVDLSQYIQPECIDYIITDPPYPQEYLSVYSDLAEFAKYALKPGGSLIAMVGQSYLPEIITMLSEHLVYHWTACYYTPGPATTLYQRRLATSWKPLLWFTKGEYTDWMNGDVFKSEQRDKNNHYWGQSESGMADIIERFTKPNELICDPFVGGGTTCMVSINMERRFVGCDIDETCVKALEEIKASMVREVQI